MRPRPHKTAFRAVCVLNALLATTLATAPAAAQEATPGVYPDGMVAFVVSESGACPSGWKPAAYAAGRMILSVTQAEDAMKSYADPISDHTAPGHDHQFEVEVILENRKSLSANGGVGAGAAGTWTSSGTSTDATPGYGFMQWAACEIGSANSGEDNLPYATIAYFSTDSCPRSWQAWPQAQGRFLLPLPEGANTTGEGYGEWSPTAPDGHGHTFVTTITFDRTDLEWLFPDTDGYAYYTPSFTDTCLTGDPCSGGGLTVPLVTLLTCEKIQDTGAGTFTDPVAIFVGGACPAGWSPVPEAAGRFLFALPDGGSQGAVFGASPLTADEKVRQHVHGGSGYVRVPVKATTQPGDGHDWSLVTADDYPYKFAMLEAGGLPFYTASFCRPSPHATAN